MNALTEPPQPPIALNSDALDILMPMHVVLDADGVIRSMGKTLACLNGAERFVGQPFLDVFDVYRPQVGQDLDRLSASQGSALHLRLHASDATRFRGVAVTHDSGLLLNLSFGISAADAVAQHGLTISDFAPTDLTVELLYLREANAATMVEARNLIRRLEGKRSEAEAQSQTDPLTGLGNRRALESYFDRLISRKGSFAILIIDLDYFKTVNDTLGHAAGDHVLSVTAERMLIATRTEDFVARVGGDEFVVLLGSRTNTERAPQIADRLIEAISEPIIYQSEVCKIGASIGGTIVHRNKMDRRVMLDAVLELADKALYKAKEQGKGRSSLYTLDC